MLVDHLIEAYPYLYHMAERGTWESIRKRGLLSTSAVLDLFRLTDQARTRYESEHREEMIAVLPDEPEKIMLRDQKPMPPDRLEQALIDETTAQEWYQLINGKVFFWAEKHRLLRLLNARAYRGKEHDVLTVNTRSLVEAHHERIWLCHMNSGNTWPIPHQRTRDIFKRISDYPAKRDGKPVKDVVEVVVDYEVPDIVDHVVEVHRMQADQELNLIWARP